MRRETITRSELHQRFVAALADLAPDGVFTFEIDRFAPTPDGCNWYPLASMAGWQGNVSHNLDAFRRVRHRLAADFNLADDEPAAAVSTPELAAAT
jgi:hypothetical protein